MKHHPSGFTLIEIIVSIAIVATLGTVTLTCVRSAKDKARMVVEVNAARTLITGYLGNAADQNGHVMPGYQNDPSTTNLEGKILSDPMNARYPWRLAPSVPAVKGVLLYNGSEAALDSENRDHLVSVHPDLELNAPPRRWPLRQRQPPAPHTADPRRDREVLRQSPQRFRRSRQAVGLHVCPLSPGKAGILRGAPTHAHAPAMASQGLHRGQSRIRVWLRRISLERKSGGGHAWRQRRTSR